MTEPLVAAEVDLRDFPFMPLDVQRLRDSTMTLKSTGEEFRAAVLLWCAAWHQEPAGSLPDDEASLASYAGFARSPREWKKVRSGALRGFNLCSDGRLYHRVLAEKANEAWMGKLKLRFKRECERIKKAAQRSKTDATYPTFEEWNNYRILNNTDQWSPANVPGDNVGKSLGTEQGRPDAVPGDKDGPSPGTHPPCPEAVPLPVPPKAPGIGDRGQGTGEVKASVPNGTGVPPLDDPLKRLWRDGVALLTGAGTEEKAARSLIGKLRKEHGDLAVLEAVTKAKTENVSDPVSWLIKTAPAMAALSKASGNHAAVSTERTRKVEELELDL